MDPSTSSPSSEQPTSIRQRCFSLAAPGEATLHFQIIDLGQMYYVWLSAGDARLTNLNMAIKTRTDTQPSVATILPAPASSQSASLARRLGAWGMHRACLQPCTPSTLYMHTNAWGSAAMCV